MLEENKEIHLHLAIRNEKLETGAEGRTRIYTEIGAKQVSKLKRENKKPITKHLGDEKRKTMKSSMS